MEITTLKTFPTSKEIVNKLLSFLLDAEEKFLKQGKCFKRNKLPLWVEEKTRPEPVSSSTANFYKVHFSFALTSFTSSFITEKLWSQ